MLVGVVERKFLGISCPAVNSPWRSRILSPTSADSSSSTLEAMASGAWTRQPREYGLISASNGLPATLRVTPSPIQSMQSNAGVVISKPKELAILAKKSWQPGYPRAADAPAFDVPAQLLQVRTCLL